MTLWKPGHRTTEFLVVVLNAVGQIVAAFAGALSNGAAARNSMVGAAAFALSRGLAKIGPKALAPPPSSTPPTVQTPPVP